SLALTEPRLLMDERRIAVGRAFAVATLVWLFVGVPLYAQILVTPISCRAFERIGSSGWRAREATTIAYSNGLVLNVRPGDIAMPGQPVDGFDLAAVLDQHCAAK